MEFETWPRGRTGGDRVDATGGSYINSKCYEICRNTSGFCSAIRKSASAGPLGFRLPCSQSCTVRRLTPIKPAKAACDNFNFRRITATGAGSLSLRVTKSFCPFLKDLISMIPSRISCPMFLSVIFYFPRNQPQYMSGNGFDFIFLVYG